MVFKNGRKVFLSLDLPKNIVWFFGIAFYLSILSAPLTAIVYYEPSPQFKSRAEIAALYIEDGDRILILHRQENKSQGNKWGIPAGKVNKGESPLQAVLRETLEETGYDFSAQPVHFFKTVFVEHNEKDHIIYHMFRAKMAFNPAHVKVNFDEHKGFTWISPQDALKMHLIDDEAACIMLTYDISAD